MVTVSYMVVAVVVVGMATCHNCGHEWEYRGKMVKATCPSCGYKTEVDQ